MQGARKPASIAGAIALLCLLTVFATSATAAGLKVCVPSKEGKPIVTPTAGVCKAGYTLTELGGEGKEGKEGAAGKEGPPGKEGAPGKEGPPGKEGAPGKEGKTGKAGPEGKSPFTAEETATLKAILPFIKFVSSGAGGEPTIRFSGVNVQVVDGSGNQLTANGLGNLVVGYDETPGSQTGSHNIILGSKQIVEGVGGLIGGEKNKISGNGNVALGFENTASGFHFADVLGGRENTASGEYASVSGGHGGEAQFAASVGGGFGNIASGDYSYVAGGVKNQATTFEAAVFGGEFGVASGESAVVVGGRTDEATAKDSAVLGGKAVKVTTEFGHTP